MCIRVSISASEITKSEFRDFYAICQSVSLVKNHSDFLLIIEKFLVSFLENALRGHAIMYAVLVLHSLSLRCV